jgi:four helix bundle protein
MATIHRVHDIRVWHLAKRLVREVYALSDRHSFRRDSALRNQMRRAVVSIISNIAEGFERDGNREFIQFLSQAKGSAGEAMSQLYVAFEQQYVDESNFYRIRSMMLQTLRMLHSLMAYLRTCPHKGKKFRNAV